MITDVAKAQGFSGVNRIYAVGDNPASDIAGANAYGDPFVSVLVHTGMFQPSAAAGTNDKQHPADIVAANVAEAIDIIAEREA